MNDIALMDKMLGLPDLTVYDFKNNDGNMVYYVRAKEDSTVCTACGVVVSGVKPYKRETQKVRDISNQGKRVQLAIEKRYFKCPESECGAHFAEPLKSVASKGRITTRLRKHIAGVASYTPFVELEREYDISDTTIGEIFLERVRQLPTLSQMVTPRIVGIDEICLVRDDGRRKRPWAVIANQGEGTVMDVLRGNKKELVVDAFRQFSNPRAVEAVTMDMWAGYRAAAFEVFPNAMAVIDKFHVVRLANDQMDFVRGKIGKELSTPYAGELRDERWVFLKREHRLTPYGKSVRDKWFAMAPLLQKTYELKESFYRMYDCSTRDDAEYYFAEWKRSIPEGVDFNGFRMIARTVESKKHKEHIFNYFYIPVTNATLEGINSAIRVISTQGRGYSFDVLRGKVLLTVGRRREVIKADFDSCTFTTFDFKIRLPEVKDYGVPIEAILRAAEAGAYT